MKSNSSQKQGRSRSPASQSVHMNNFVGEDCAPGAVGVQRELETQLLAEKQSHKQTRLQWIAHQERGRMFAALTIARVSHESDCRAAALCVSAAELQLSADSGPSSGGAHWHQRREARHDALRRASLVPHSELLLPFVIVSRPPETPKLASEQCGTHPDIDAAHNR